MSKRMKRRLAAVTGVIVIAVVLVMAVIGSNGAAASVTVADLADGSYGGKKVEVSGSVVEGSYSIDDGVLTFAIYDPDGDVSQTVDVSYDGSVSTTFGSDITAICTGSVAADGTLECSELVTKCPSKYEDSDEALTVSQLLGYGDDIVDTIVKVSGTLADGTLQPSDADVGFVLADADGDGSLPVAYDGALSDEVTDGAALVVTGTLAADGTFTASEVAIAS